jgi:hypothetical protein
MFMVCLNIKLHAVVPIASASDVFVVLLVGCLKVTYSIVLSNTICIQIYENQLVCWNVIGNMYTDLGVISQWDFAKQYCIV